MGKSYTLEQEYWRWYQDDGAEPTSALASEVTKPTLADYEKIRLRVNIDETGGDTGTLTLNLQYSTDEVSWYDFGSSAHWNWADGQATAGDTLTGYKLTSSNALGQYHEAAGVDDNMGAYNIEEFDCCIQQTSNCLSSTTYYFRVLNSTTEVPLADTQTHPQVLTLAGSSSPSASVSATPSATPSSSVSSSPSQSSSVSASPSATPSSSVSATPSASVSSTPSASVSATPSSSVSSSPSQSSSVSASPSSSPSSSPSPSATPSASPSSSNSPSSSISPSATPSSTPSSSISPSSSVSATPSASVSATPSSSPSASVSSSPSSSVSASTSSSPSASVSATPSSSVSATPSSSPSQSSSVSSSPSSSTSSSPSSSRSPSASVSATPSSSPSPSASYMYDPIVESGCPQCGTLLYDDGDYIRSDAVYSGRNQDKGVHSDRKYVRCARCGFMCNADRDRKGRRGSKEGWGITNSRIERGT